MRVSFTTPLRGVVGRPYGGGECYPEMSDLFIYVKIYSVGLFERLYESFFYHPEGVVGRPLGVGECYPEMSDLFIYWKSYRNIIL